MAQAFVHAAASIAIAAMTFGCGGGVPNPAAASAPVLPAAAAADPSPSGAVASSASDRCEPQGPQCTFARGVLTCSQVVSQDNTVTVTQEFSGCSTSGSRVRTYLNHFQVTTTLTTSAHGRCGPVFDSSTSTEQVLLSRDLVSDVCTP